MQHLKQRQPQKTLYIYSGILERNQVNLNRNIKGIVTANIPIKFLNKRTSTQRKLIKIFLARLEENLLLLEKVLKPTLDFSFAHYIYTCH